MKSIVLSLFLIGSYFGTAQEQLNNYKYVIVPKLLDGFKKKNEHQTSTLVKYLFAQKGVTVVYDDALPDELNSDRCLGLVADLINDSNLFTTKTSIVLKDCFSNEVFVSQEGTSRLKEFKAAYSESIRKAFRSLDALNYSYKPKARSEAPVIVSFKDDVKELAPEKIKEQKEKQQDPIIKQEATPEQQSYKNLEPVPSDIKKANETHKQAAIISGMGMTGVLYAQQVSNGYQLVDSTPLIKLKIFKSSVPDFYIAKSDDNNGVVYKKDGKWFFEYYKGEQLTVEELNIKF